MSIEVIHGHEDDCIYVTLKGELLIFISGVSFAKETKSTIQPVPGAFIPPSDLKNVLFLAATRANDLSTARLLMASAPLNEPHFQFEILSNLISLKPGQTRDGTPTYVATVGNSKVILFDSNYWKPNPPLNSKKAW
jgi:hypothetical protein